MGPSPVRATSWRECVISEPSVAVAGRARLRGLVPDGTSAVGWGLLVNGLTTYGFLVVTQRSVGDEAYGSFAVLWALVNIGGPGLFQPLEQEISRATADRASRGDGSAPVLRRAAVLGGVQAVLVGLLLLGAWPVGLGSLLDGRAELLVVLILALGTFAGAQLVRGILGGRRRFGPYGWYFAVEGGSRLAIGAALAAAGLSAVGGFGMALPAAFLIATATMLVAQRPFVRPGPPASYGDLTPALGLLLVASISEAFILNVGPVAVEVAGGEDLGPEAPGVFLNAMIIARIPLFFFQAVKASLLPSLARLAGRGDLAGFRNMQLEMVAAVAAAGVLWVGVMTWAGPTIVRLVFADDIGSGDMGLLAASGAGLMLMLALGLGLIALGHTRLAVAGWGAGVAAFAAASLIDLDPFLRVELALLIAVLVGSAVAGLLLRLEYAAHRRSA